MSIDNLADTNTNTKTKTIHRIINGDSHRMTELDDHSIDLVITSPPYWQLKDYGTENGIGFHDTYESYINRLNLVWQECFRVLDKGCRLCVNIGDQYARSVYYGRYKVIPIRTEIIKFCETLGFDYMGAIIWQKLATTNTTGGATIMGSYPLPRNGILKLDYEFILIFKKPGRSSKPISSEQKTASQMTKEEWNAYFSGHWNFPGVKQKKHLAMFPVELPRRLIKMFSFQGDTVLDPFLGSGTTSLAAMELLRHSVGYEINKDFIPLIATKLGATDGELFNYQDVRFEQQESPLNLDFDKEIEKLPYIFKDPVKLDKKIDPRKNQFGSKIDNQGKQRETYYSVKGVISPSQLLLNNDQRIKLIGIKPVEQYREQAIAYLHQVCKGQRVFMKFDKKKKEDAGDVLPCYLYLKNKTFINAHLIKKGLVQPDVSYEYRHKNRFIKYSNMKK